MEKEKNPTVSPVFREFVTLSVYKRSQGRIARQVTFGALVATFAIGAYRLKEFWVDQPAALEFLVPGLIGLAGLWISYRMVNVPRFADFLIAVEAEMNKVSWPTRSELIRSALVVLFVIFALAFILFGYDIFWRWILSLLGVVGYGGGG